MKKRFAPDVFDLKPDTPSYEVYLAEEVDAVLKRQAAAAMAGMHAAAAISSGQLQQAHRLRAESSPESLESERQANAILTDRIAELEEALREIAGYPQPDEDLDSVAQDMRRCARGVLRPSS